MIRVKRKERRRCPHKSPAERRRIMNEVLKTKLDTFVENKSIVSKSFKFQNDALSVAAAMVFTNAGRKPDVEKMKECRTILKGKTGALSGFRGMVELSLITKMSLQENPEQYIDDVLRVFKMIRSSKISDHYEEIMAAMSVVEMGHMNDVEAVVEKYEDIMGRMKKEHPLITSYDDSPFAMLLALSEKDVDSIITEMEECYRYMKKNFKAGWNATQGISEVFTLYDTDIKTKCDRAIEIYNLLKDHGVKYGKDHEFASLAILANVPMDTNVLVEEIVEASDYLKKNNGFGNWTLGQSERYMFAAVAVAGVYDEEVNDIGSSMTNTIATVVVAGEIDLSITASMVTADMLLFT
jgi:ethanolamine utilization cobalamin adenosyltransferase